MSQEIDALVAEKVFGWKRDPKNQGSWIPPGREPLAVGFFTARPGAYTTDPSADYEVLKHVREKWGRAKLKQFILCLDDVWNARIGANGDKDGMWAVMYEPGDYARAALKALGEEI